MTSEYLPLIVILPLVGAIFNGLLGRWCSKGTVSMMGCGSVLAAFVLSVSATWQLMGVHAHHPADAALSYTVWNWLESGSLNVSMSFFLDPLSTVMLLVVTGVGSLIHIFSVGYMQNDKAYWRYFCYLNLFMFSMLLLILGKNLLVLFIGWEGVGLCSYLLIGFWYQDMEKSVAGQKAFVANRVGDLCFLVGTFILLFYSQGELDFTRLHTLVEPGGTLAQDPATVTLICLLFFGGATGKSAQIPLFVWLPDAMAGPTPVSALIHAATMVTAGVYMMARMNFLFAASEAAMTTIAFVGAATAFFAATIALVQNDIKKVLAYSTVSQIGFMVLAIGVGGFVGAIFHLMTHAFFKACLFLGSGSVIHALHHASAPQDIRTMGGLKEKLPITATTFFVSCLAIAGIFPFAGFFSKDEILFTAFTAQHGGNAPLLVAYGLALVAAVFTAFYMFRLYYLTFEGEFRGDAHDFDHAHEETIMNIPLLVLAFLAAVGGSLGLPAAFHLPHRLHDWLEPVFHKGMSHYTYSHDHTLEWILMGVSLGIAVAGALTARTLYRRPAAKLPKAPVDAWWYRGATQKWYVDEIYEAIVMRPLHRVAKFAYLTFDLRIVDAGFVLGPARMLRRVGQSLRLTQNGDVQAYVTVIVVGFAICLMFLN